MSDSDWQDDDEGWVDDHAPTSPLVSGVRKFAQGAAGSFSDELAGLTEGAGRALGVNGAGGPMKDIGLADEGPTMDWDILKDAYKRARDKERAALAQDSKENPAASMAGELGGMIASPINKIAKGMSLAKGGAALGGINALGASDADNAADMVKDVGIGVGTGAVLGKAVEGASPYIERGLEKASGGARDLAERFGARALGAERGTIKSMGMDKVKGAAAQMLDEGGFSPFASTDDLIAKNAALKAKGGGLMGQAYDAIDDAGASTFNPREVAEQVDDKLGGFWRAPLNKGEANQFDNTIASILERGPGDIPIKEAQLLKEELGAAANWKNNLNITPKEQMARDAYRVVSDQIDEAVKLGQGAVDQAGLSEILSQGKDIYSKASTAEKLLTNKAAREQGNNLIGLTDAITGAGALGYGGTTGDWQTAGGVMLAKKGLQKYGAQNAAIGLNKISKALMKSPKMADLAQRSPQVFSAIVQKMEGAVAGASKAADAGQKPFDQDALLEKTQGSKYGQVLQDASKRGGAALGAAHFVLQGKDPEYRKLTLGDEEEH